MSDAQWQPIETLPELMFRPSRYFVRFEGYQVHSGARWAREWIDLVSSNGRQNNPWDISEYDLQRVREQADMDYIEAVTHWLPMSVLPLVQP